MKGTLEVQKSEREIVDLRELFPEARAMEIFIL